MSTDNPKRKKPSITELKEMIRGIKFEAGEEHLVTSEKIENMAQCDVPFDTIQILMDLGVINPTGNIGEFFVCRSGIVHTLPRKNKQEEVTLIECPHCNKELDRSPCPECGKDYCEICHGFGWCYSNNTPFIDLRQFNNGVTT